MWTTAKIRRQLARMVGDKPFSIRAFLAFGSRHAVDQCFARLVKNGEVIRVARGLYIKPNSPFPSVAEVALAKAAAFRRTIVIHGSQAAAFLKLVERSDNEHLFAVNGCSSSFRFGNQVIRFISTTARKMHLGDSKSGLAISALWYLGKRLCTMEIVSMALASFGRTDRKQLEKHADLMPEWMQALLFSIKRYWQERQRLEYTQENLYGFLEPKASICKKWPLQLSLNSA
jgi:hypothetical protein